MDVVSYVTQFGTDSLAGLVLVNGIAGREYDLDTMRNLLKYANSIQTDRQKATERFVRGLYKKPQSENYLKRMVAAALRTPTDAAMAVFLASLSSDNRSALAKIDKPTLIIVARVDSWMPFYEDLRNRIPGSRMKVFEGAGHALFVDEAPQFNSLLEEFVESLVAAQSVQPYNPGLVMTSLL
jgi:microsomal epoxide hydrolase